MRTRASAKPKAPAKTQPPISEDDAAIRALLNEASLTLSRCPGYVGRDAKAPLSGLPLYLLVGPEGSGKTSTFMNCGLEPQLLAGDATPSPASLPTRLCNLWLAKDALFLEVSGRVFNGGFVRWQQILKTLQARPKISVWEQLWKEPPAGYDLRGVVAFCDVKHFQMASSPEGRERLDEHCRHWQERLGSVAEVFGLEFPVYLLVTKCDALPYFSDYFRRLPESEIGQVFGSTFPSFESLDSNKGQPVEAEAKRFTKAFNAIYQTLAERRILHLTHEPDPGQRPGIYEFPREFKRIRTAATQFLSTAFRSNPLRLNPHLRGFYLSGVAERQAVALAAAAHSGAQWADQSVGLEATGLFRSDATQIFRASEAAGAPKIVPQGGFTRRWLFVSELFQSVVLTQKRNPRSAPRNAKVEQYRKLACAGVCAVCLLLCAVVVRAWNGNLQLLESATPLVTRPDHGTAPRLDELQSLEQLRLETSRLVEYQHGGAPLRLRWGLYMGNRIATPEKELYFRRFQALLLDRLNAAIVAHLLALPTTPGSDDPYSPASRLLKAHLMIAGAASCSPEPALVSGVLKENLPDIAPAENGNAEWTTLASRQIDFYSGELAYGKPCKLSQNAAARDHATQYLAGIRGVDRIYSGILARAEKAMTKPQKLSDFSPGYAEVLSGPGEVSGVFTVDGWRYVESASKNSAAGAPDDVCVVAGNALFGESKQDAEVERGVQRMFLRDYAERWRKFVGGFSVKGYGSPADAARKLELLSDHKSPLLAVLAMTSNQTTFPRPVAEPEVLDRVKPVVKKFFPSFANSKVRNTAAEPNKSAEDGMSRPADVARLFQPVHYVVPAGSETWVIDKNSAYIDALAQLGHSMQDIARSPATPDPAIYQAASQNYDKALDAARQIARGFEPLGVAGLDVAVERLLEAPVRQTQRFIVTDMEGAAAGKVNGELHGMCTRIASTLHKYPFKSSKEDATLAEVSAVFAPGSGAIWKFQAQCLADFVIKEGGRWNAKDPAKKPQVTPEMLAFLNRAQSIGDALFPPGATQPQFVYTLRPKVDASYKDAVLELEVDGQSHAWTSSLQKQFTWPAPAGGANSGAVGRIKSGSLSFPFASRGGTWGIFRVMGDAEPRAIGSKVVEWKFIRGGDGRLEEIQPAPVRLEIVEFPGGVDLFNPAFLEALQCPGKAVQ